MDSSPSTPPAKRLKTSDSPAVLPRNQRVRDLAEQRDKSRCVLTGDLSIEVAHIYPYHSIKHEEVDIFSQRHIFWNHLKGFWSKGRVAAWEAELFPAGICEIGIERVYNLITLSRTAHDKWARGAFALKPISESDDKMTLKVQFFWQEKQTDAQTMNLLTTPLSTESLDQNVGAFDRGGAVWLSGDDCKRIKSGDYFKLETDDPETKPLPSFQLLELQWFLQRIQGMAGAADIDWPPYSDSGSDYSDKEEIPDLTFDEIGNSSLMSSDPLPSPAKFVRNDNSHLPDYTKHRTEGAEEVEGEGAEGRDRDRRQVTM